MNQILNIISEGLKKNLDTTPRYLNAINKMKCPVCKSKLIQKKDWIFCPLSSDEIPECDTQTHMAYNIKTHRGWCCVL